MNFEELVDAVFSDEHTFNIPALYIVQILMVLDSKDLLKKGDNICTSITTDSITETA